MEELEEVGRERGRKGEGTRGVKAEVKGSVSGRNLKTKSLKGLKRQERIE